jgi:hypothetical protein
LLHGETTAITVKTFGAVGDGVTDDTTAIQAAFTYAESQNRKILAPAGHYLTTAELNYTVTSTDQDFASGIVIEGEGMGKTVFLPKFSNGAFLYIQSTEPYFAKGCSIKGITILGETITGPYSNQVGIRTKGVWWSTLENVRVIKLNGTAFLAGDDDTVLPDDTANAGMIFISCEFDENVGGISNPVNNNAPFILVTNCGIRNNSQFGIVGNSSYIEIRGGSVSFNGILDAANSLGGIVFKETTGTAGYRSKGLLIDGVELDTNYPYQADVQRASTLQIENCSIQFKDYASIDWASAGITQWPESQLRLGGTVNNDQVWSTIIESNRVSIASLGTLGFHPNGHAIVHVRPYGFGTRYKDIMHNLELGAGTLGSDFYVLKEDDKTGTGREDRKFYSVIDYPMGNLSASQVIAGFSTHTKQVLPSFEAFHARNMHFAFDIADDAVKIIPVPTVSSEITAGANYGMASINAQGAAVNSCIVTYRAATSPECVAIAEHPSSSNVETATGVLTGTTGTNGRLIVSVDDVGNLYIENRTGASRIVFLSFLMAPGIINQI